MKIDIIFQAGSFEEAQVGIERYFNQKMRLIQEYRSIFTSGKCVLASEFSFRRCRRFGWFIARAHIILELFNF
jgi:hypothetical protein